MIRDKKCAEDTSGQLPTSENLKNWSKNLSIMRNQLQSGSGSVHPFHFQSKRCHSMAQYAVGKPKIRFFSKQFFPNQCPLGNGSTKTDFQRIISRGRCLIPADGWFEWQIIEGQKYPHHIYSENGKILRLQEFGNASIKR